MMMPISVDSAWYENHWYGDPGKARPNRKTVARILVPLVATCIVGLFGWAALFPREITTWGTGFGSMASSLPSASCHRRPGNELRTVSPNLAN
jgi:hypothetical protein